ncbi:S-adenosyl-L-methionine-dependent methyltransferase [Ceratobasidium sp. AG-I]|nr:S-adenosyl-L-methionine-dependent methyltransferase [Ceratobasidium sp. AG-I]
MADTPERTNQLRDLHGRQVNSLSQDYKLPADPQEMRRLSTQHRLMSLALGGLYPSNYAEAIRRRLEHREGETIHIADLGSGSGHWITEMAREFPHVQALGIDLSPSVPVNAPANVAFEIGDVTKGVLDSYMEKFDFVQARSIAVIDMPALIASMSRCLKPGGIIMLGEGSMDVYDEHLKPLDPNEYGGIPKLFAEAEARIPAPHGRDKDKSNTNFLEKWLLQQEGVQDVKTEVLYIPVGWTGSSEFCKEPAAAGQLMVDNMTDFLGSWNPLFLSMGVPEDEVNTWVTEAREQLAHPDKLRAYTRWTFACAQRSS